MPHDGLHCAQVPCLLVDADGPSVAKAVEGLVRRNEAALGLVARPLGLEVVSVEGLFHSTEDVLGWRGCAPPKVGGALPHTEGWGRFCSYRSCCGFQTVRCASVVHQNPPM